MNARAALAVLLLFCACSEERKRDPVVAKAELPVKLTVRKHDVRYKPPCEETGFNVYKCWLAKPEHTGCIYLDVGEPFDDPSHENPCENNRENRLLLASPPAELDFEVDPAGFRFAWRVEATWSVGYLWNGRLIRSGGLIPPTLNLEEALAPGRKRAPLPSLGGALPTLVKATGPIDWSALKSFDDALPDLYFQAQMDAQEGMLARLRKLGGEDAVVKMLTEHFGIVQPGWEAAFETLESPQQRKVAVAAEKALFDDGNEEAMDWFDEHPELAPPDLERRLTARAKDALPRGELEVTQRWLTRGFRKHNPEVGAIACQLLEAEDLINTWGQGEGGYYDATAYAVISASHTQCAEVTRSLGSNPCDSSFRCTHDEDSTETLDIELAPLCNASDIAKVRRVLEDDDDPPEEYEQAARLGALLAQGPLPRAFVLSDARRSYQLLRPDAGGDEGYASVCSAERPDVSRFLCAIRPEQTHFTVSGCKVEIDDEKKTVRLTPLDVPDAGR